MVVEKSSVKKQKKKMRWLDGYKFWRGQYAVRNSEFITMKKVREELRNEFITKAQETLDKEIVDILGIGAYPNPPIINEKYMNVLSSLPDDVRDVMAQLSCLDDYIVKFFPNFFIPKRINAESIIISIRDSLFDSFIESKKLNRNSLIYRGVSYFDLSRNVMLINSHNEKSKFVSLKIDCSADIGHILKSVCSLIEAQKLKMGEEFCSCKEFVDIDLELFLTKKRLGVAYNVGAGSDNSRAIGLLIYDYIAETGCTQTAAIDAVMGLPLLRTFGGKDKDSYRDALKRMHRRTKKCVEHVEVLKIQ